MDISKFTIFQISLAIVKSEFNYTSVFGVGNWGTNETDPELPLDPEAIRGCYFLLLFLIIPNGILDLSYFGPVHS